MCRCWLFWSYFNYALRLCSPGRLDDFERFLKASEPVAYNNAMPNSGLAKALSHRENRLLCFQHRRAGGGIQESEVHRGGAVWGELGGWGFGGRLGYHVGF